MEETGVWCFGRGKSFVELISFVELRGTLLRVPMVAGKRGLWLRHNLGTIREIQTASDYDNLLDSAVFIKCMGIA